MNINDIRPVFLPAAVAQRWSRTGQRLRFTRSFDLAIDSNGHGLATPFFEVLAMSRCKTRPMTAYPTHIYPIK
jgi:hypothetical protein